MAGPGPSADDLRMQNVYRRWFSNRARMEVGPTLLWALAKHGRHDRFEAVMRLLVASVAHFDEDEEAVARAELRVAVRRILPRDATASLLGLLLSYRPRFVDAGRLHLSYGTTEPATIETIRRAHHRRVGPLPRPPKLVGPRRPCLCGCGGFPKSAKARYLPGHDSRHRALQTR